MKVDDLFSEDYKEAASLCKLKLPLKKSTEKLLLSKPTDGYTTHYSIIQMWRGKIIERVFATRLYRKKPQYQEVLRRIEGNNYVCQKNLWFNKFSGWKTIWDKRSYSWYFSIDDFNKWVVSWVNNMFAHHLFTMEDLKKIDPSLTYCSYKYCNNVTRWITIYRKYPEIEMLAKLEAPNLANNIRVLEKLKDKQFKKYLCNCGLNYNATGRDVLYGFNHNLPLQEVYIVREINLRTNKIRKEYPNIPEDKLKKYLRKYFDKQHYHLSVESYLDMIEAEEYLKLDLTQEKNIFPHDFQKWHDHYTEQMEVAQSKEIDEKIDKQAAKYRKLEKEIENLKMILPHKTEEFINEGKALHHCVGKNGYNKKMARGESLIIFIRKLEEINTPFLTMEYDPKEKKIKQLYGEYNHMPEEDIREIIYNKWLPKIKRIKFA